MSKKRCGARYFLKILLAGLAAAFFCGGCEPNPYEEPVLPDGEKQAMKEVPGSLNAGECEVTYELWYTVRVWAEANGYNFLNKGWEGGKNTNGARPSGSGKNMPVTGITWRDAMVWCNAYSEMNGKLPVYEYQYITAALIRGEALPHIRGFYENEEVIKKLPNPAVGHIADNGETKTEWRYTAEAVWVDTGNPILTTKSRGIPDPDGTAYWYEYTFAPIPIRDSSMLERCSRAQISAAASAAGSFRLPTKAEWEAFADSPYAGTSGGSIDDLKQAAWYDGTTLPGDHGNPDYGVHSAGSLLPNSKDLYDMSGNVWEWCWDAEPVQELEYATNVYPTLLSALPQPPDVTPPLVLSRKSSDKPLLDPAHRINTRRQASILKGGGWYSNAEECETAAAPPAAGDALRLGNDIGFRIVQSQ